MTTGEGPRHPARIASAAKRDGVVVFAIVVAGAFAYALGARTTYRATADVRIDRAPDSGETPWPGASQAAARLRAELLDSEFLARLGRRERAESEEGDSPEDSLADSVRVETTDAHRFVVSATATSASGAERVVNELARRAVEAAPSILGQPAKAAMTPESKLALDLTTFLRAHPSASAGDAPLSENAEPITHRLREERRQVEAQLRPPAPSENPYADAIQGSRQALEKRLREIDAELADTKRAPAAAADPSAAEASTLAREEERAEFQRRLRALVDVRAAVVARPLAVRASFVAASFPKAPEKPNRALVVLVGFAVGTVWGIGAAVGRNYWIARAARRSSQHASAHRRAAAALDLEHSGDGAFGRRVAEVLWPARHPVRPAQIISEPVRSDWRPNPALRFALHFPLCDELLPFAVENCFVVGVTAVPEATARKAGLASELALALAEPGDRRVLLLDASFNAPEVHRALRLDVSESGSFSQQLRSRREGGGDAEWHVVDCGRSLHVMADASARSPGMLLSSQFEEAIRSLRTYYDFIVVNGPITSAELDCRALDAVLDGIIVACPPGGSPFLERALGIFEAKRFSRVVEV